MSVIAPNFKLSEFIKSILDVGFWALLIFVLIGLPAVFMILFVIEMPVINGEILTPFLALTWLADPSRVLPIIKAFMTTDIFRVAAFPGFGFAALIAASTIFVERKMMAKLQLRVGPFYCGKLEGILQLMGDGLKLISKEIIIPAKADKPIFWAAPVLFVGTAAAFV
ncbi:MAG: NADH-quinone oxidoreductase subunit H, partial [Nitrosopumilus sp.]|nr:NADH-quinone oxidoreductase subunit H [Nitrosopumilus sp.]